MATRPLSGEELARRAAAVERHDGDYRAAALELGIATVTLRACLRERGASPGGGPPAAPSSSVHLPEDSDDGYVVSGVTPRIPSDAGPGDDAVIEYLKEKRVNLETWVPVAVRVQTYSQAIGEGKVVEMPYMRVDLRRRTGMVLVNVVAPPPKRTFRPLKPRKGAPEVTVLMSCDQAPYQDERAHELVCALLAKIQPHRAVHLGDLLDAPAESRHEPNINRNASMAECAVVGHRLLSERIDAFPRAEWVFLEGNHDARLRQYVVKQAGAAIASLAPVGETEPLLSVPRLLHLDALGVRYKLDDVGTWDHAELELAPELIAIHGLETTKTGAAAKTAADLGVSVICGHTHRQRMTPVTTKVNRVPVVREAMEVGCLCRPDLGYKRGPDWQQGVGVLYVWPDGSHDVELARIDDGELRWRGERLYA